MDWSEYPNVSIIGSFEELDQIQSDGSEARNSRIRELLEPYLNAVADWIVKKFPVSPNLITLAGAAGMMVGAGLANKAQLAEDKMFALAMEAFFAGWDAWDGMQARAMNRERKKSGEPMVPNYWGPLLDTMMDRIVNSGMAALRADSAHKRGSKLGEIAALAMLATSPISALGRKHAERNLLLAVKEDRGLGSQFGRMIAQVLITTFPSIKGVEIQPIVDTMLAAMAVKVGWSRFHTDKQPGEKTPVSEATYNQARLIYPAMWAVAVGAAVASFTLYKHFHKDRA